MVFNSLTFLLFFAIVLALHRLPLPWRVRKLNLLLASYLFYAAWSPPFVVLLWISTAIDWFVSRGIWSAKSQLRKRALLCVSLGVNLGVLGFFKYADFAMENFQALAEALGIAYQAPQWKIILPLGISFYTLQTLSYTFDVYRRKNPPWNSLLDYALYVTFFPQLVAGPIVRSGDFLPQCVEPKRASTAQLGWGLALLTIGLFEKVVLADNLLAPVADEVFAATANAGFADAWLGTLAFSAQIFFDFAGYSTCAIGVGLCMGFVLPDNFKFPYGSIGFSDFWQRWHISLSTWLRDYLYIPLGGNRKGVSRTYINLMLTMLIGGLWHGASWRFVVWGGLHGLYLIVERLTVGNLEETTRGQRWTTRLGLALLTYVLVCITWVFFRAPDFHSAIEMIQAMFTGMGTGGLVDPDDTLNVLLLTVALVGGHILWRNTTIEHVWTRLPWWLKSIILAVLVGSIILSMGTERAFIYFQF